MRLGRSAEQLQFAAALHDLLTADGTGADAGNGAGTGAGAGAAAGNGARTGAGAATGAGAGTGAARRWAAGDRAPGLALWRRLAELGVTALAVPPCHGGLGATPLDLVVACEELGHHAVPGPAAESLAAVPQLLAACADASLGQRWLPGLASGDVIATLAMPPRLPYAADADVATLVLLAQADRILLAVPGSRHPSVDPARSLFEVGGTQLLASGPAVASATARALHWGTLACAAQLLGAGQALLEASIRHAVQRVQFGRPVGAFQAVKHQLADVAIGLEFARPLLDAAAVALPDEFGPAAGRDVSAAKVACADAASRAARTALQVHGAIGYTQEHDLSLWLTKVRALVPAWGSQAEHRAAVLAAVAQDRESTVR